MSLAFRLTARAGGPIGDADTLDEVLTNLYGLDL
jgi:hypothetical protein